MSHPVARCTRYTCRSCSEVDSFQLGSLLRSLLPPLCVDLFPVRLLPFLGVAKQPFFIGRIVGARFGPILVSSSLGFLRLLIALPISLDSLGVALRIPALCLSLFPFVTALSTLCFLRPDFLQVSLAVPSMRDAPGATMLIDNERDFSWTLLFIIAVIDFINPRSLISKAIRRRLHSPESSATGDIE